MANFRGEKRTVIRQEFYVVGDGIFPLDMLRYDNCFPASTDDCNRIGLSILKPYKKTHTIKLVRLVDARGYNPPTEGRWASFGWEVQAEVYGQLTQEQAQAKKERRILGC